MPCIYDDSDKGNCVCKLSREREMKFGVYFTVTVEGEAVCDSALEILAERSLSKTISNKLEGVDLTTEDQEIMWMGIKEIKDIDIERS